jgi:uncharacterized membrane protein
VRVQDRGRTALHPCGVRGGAGGACRLRKKLAAGLPLAGAAIGAASGAIGGALTDVGLNDNWMKETAAAIQPGTAALFVLGACPNIKQILLAKDERVRFQLAA